MLDRLVASAPARSWFLSGTMMSVAFHGAVLYVAIQTTMGTGGTGREAVADTMLVFVQPENEPDKPPPPPDVQLGQLPDGFKALLAPVSIPTDIPPVNLKETFDPRDYSGIGKEHAASEFLKGAGDVGPGATYAEAAVDEKPEIISSPPLQYPDILRQAGVEGDVLIEAIIDTTGKAEPGSVRVLHSTHPAFDKEAMDVVSKSLYRPGRMGGVPVRVLVNVPVTFSIRKRVA